jgi:U6 snRNA-associated Sm-like protein LSm7
MSERGAFRGGRGGGRGGERGGRGGARGGAHGGGAAAQTERPKKENILDLSKYMDKQITVKFSGGREGKRSPGVKEGTMRRGRGQDLIEESTTSY